MTPRCFLIKKSEISGFLSFLSIDISHQMTHNVYIEIKGSVAMKKKIIVITSLVVLFCSLLSAFLFGQAESFRLIPMTTEQLLDIVEDYKDREITDEIAFNGDWGMVVRSDDPDFGQLSITTLSDGSVRYEFYDARKEIMYTLNSVKSLKNEADKQALLKSEAVEMVDIREVRKNTTFTSNSIFEYIGYYAKVLSEAGAKKMQDIYQLMGNDVIILSDSKGFRTIKPNGKK